MGIDDKTLQFLEKLHQGGSWGYWWTLPGKKTTWWQVGNAAAMPNGKQDIYFGVHPAKDKGKTNDRAKIPNIEAVNCLFAEFDDKDFGSAMLTLKHVADLDPIPSVVIRSGGGYHAYWLLEEPYILDDNQKMDKAIEIQAKWVQYTGGDNGAKDLSRVLRVPGTFNYKYDPPREVEFFSIMLDRTFDLADLAAKIIIRPAPGPAPKRKTQAPKAPSDIADQLLKKYLKLARPGNRNDTGAKLAQQLRDTARLTQAEAITVQYPEKVSSGPGSNGQGYTRAEWEATVKSIYTRPPRLPAESPCTDVANADRLVRQFGNQFRWTKGWGYLVWDGYRWKRDTELEMRGFAKVTARYIYQESADAGKAGNAKLSDILHKWAKTSLSKQKIEAMIDLAANEVAIPVDDFDNQLMLFNVENGTIDLKAGELLPHDQNDLITKVAGTYYDPDAECPLWLSFLDRIMGNDGEMIDFLQRAVGYSMMGKIKEQVLFFCYGTGANGKTTFLKTIMEVFGDYGIQTAPDLLMAGKRHPTEIADLQGARFAATIEIDEGRKIAESLTKQLTGGDRLKARYMRQDFFEFDAECKIWMAANHKPVVKGTDHAIWRRITLIPFDEKIPEDEQDTELIYKLLEEKPGILAWCVKGVLDYNMIELDKPQKVIDATTNYQHEMDTVQNYLDENCFVDPQAEAPAGALYDDFRNWCIKNGEDVIRNTKFRNRLLLKNFTQVRKNTGMFWQGIGMITPTPGPIP